MCKTCFSSLNENLTYFTYLCCSSGSFVRTGAVLVLLRSGCHEASAVRPALRRRRDASGRRLSQPLHDGTHGTTEDAAGWLPPHDEDAWEHGGPEGGGHEAGGTQSGGASTQQPEAAAAAPAPGPAGQSLSLLNTFCCKLIVNGCKCFPSTAYVC